MRPVLGVELAAVVAVVVLEELLGAPAAGLPSSIGTQSCKTYYYYYYCYCYCYCYRYCYCYYYYYYYYY